MKALILVILLFLVISVDGKGSRSSSRGSSKSQSRNFSSIAKLFKGGSKSSSSSSSSSWSRSGGGSPTRRWTPSWRSSSSYSSDVNPYRSDSYSRTYEEPTFRRNTWKEEEKERKRKEEELDKMYNQSLIYMEGMSPETQERYKNLMAKLRSPVESWFTKTKSPEETKAQRNYWEENEKERKRKEEEQLDRMYNQSLVFMAGMSPETQERHKKLMDKLRSPVESWIFNSKATEDKKKEKVAEKSPSSVFTTETTELQKIQQLVDRLRNPSWLPSTVKPVEEKITESVNELENDGMPPDFQEKAKQFMNKLRHKS